MGTTFVEPQLPLEVRGRAAVSPGATGSMLFASVGLVLSNLSDRCYFSTDEETEAHRT